ncbi:MAG: hypothetical protein KDB60_00525 [Propionibacteriaceae bacterium]|nr:hypothetical protein [Propionibacteriaceae bacterium]
MSQRAVLAVDAVPRIPVSVVCVYNDSSVLASCLEASMRDGQPEAPQTELIAIDNEEHSFSTAADALNEGARRARNDVVAFVHQDVVLHSLPALESAAGELLRSPDIGVLGAVGIDRNGQIVGRIRDRVVPIGESTPTPRDAETLDEVIFLARRDQLREAPVLNEPTLAWHAYAVEYSVRMRRAGKRVATVNIPLTHNSLSTNLDRLDVAHRWVGDHYPEFLPIRTTCGTVYSERQRRDPFGVGRRARGLRRWLRESGAARELTAGLPPCPVVLADIRPLIDSAAGLAGKKLIHALDVAGGRDVLPKTVELDRYGRSYVAESGSVGDAMARLDVLTELDLLLVTGLCRQDLALLIPYGSAPRVLGYAGDIGVWLMFGASSAELDPLWNRRRNRPIAFPRLRRRSH